LSSALAGGIEGGLANIKATVASLLRPSVLLDILAHFTLFATDKKKRRIKIVCRYQQYEAGNQIVQRVLAGHPKKGLIWHFQGSGKSLLMVFAAQKLRMQTGLKNPTVIIAVDRIDLDAQISATFHASDIPNLVKAETRDILEQLLLQDTRKIIITTIHKFGEVEGLLNERENIIVFADEAHRTQEGNLGIRMRAALPHAFFFGFTGTPINRRDRNTFATFGAVEDPSGYMNRYRFDESIRDGATLPLRFEPRLVELHIDKAAINAAYSELTGGLADLDKETLSRSAAKMAVLVQVPERVAAICTDIARHYQEKVRPNGFKAMVVTYDQESCLRYKKTCPRKRTRIAAKPPSPNSLNRCAMNRHPSSSSASSPRSTKSSASSASPAGKIPLPVSGKSKRRFVKRSLMSSSIRTQSYSTRRMGM